MVLLRVGSWLPEGEAIGSLCGKKPPDVSFCGPPKHCSKDVPSLMGASGSPPRDSSQEATVGGWLKSARQSGSSDGLQVSVI